MNVYLMSLPPPPATFSVRKAAYIAPASAAVSHSPPNATMLGAAADEYWRRRVTGTVSVEQPPAGNALLSLGATPEAPARGACTLNMDGAIKLMATPERDVLREFLAGAERNWRQCIIKFS